MINSPRSVANRTTKPPAITVDGVQRVQYVHPVDVYVKTAECALDPSGCTPPLYMTTNTLIDCIDFSEPAPPDPPAGLSGRPGVGEVNGGGEVAGAVEGRGRRTAR